MGMMVVNHHMNAMRWFWWWCRVFIEDFLFRRNCGFLILHLAKKCADRLVLRWQGELGKEWLICQQRDCQCGTSVAVVWQCATPHLIYCHLHARCTPLLSDEFTAKNWKVAKIMMIAVQPTVTVFPPQPESIWGVSRVECVATKSSVYYVYCVADSCIMCSQLSTMPLVPVQCTMCITRCKRAKCTMYRKKYRYRYPLTFWVSSHTVVVCSILCAESSVQCSAQYSLHSILCTVFSAQYSPSPVQYFLCSILPPPLTKLTLIIAPTCPAAW